MNGPFKEAIKIAGADATRLIEENRTILFSLALWSQNGQQHLTDPTDL